MEVQVWVMFPLNRCWLWNLPAPTASELRWQQTQPLAPTFYSATHILTLPQTAPLLEISKAHLFWVGYRRRDWGIKEAFNRIPPGQPLSTFWFMDSCQQITFRSNVFQQQTPHSQSWLNSKEIHVFFSFHKEAQMGKPINKPSFQKGICFLHW